MRLVLTAFLCMLMGKGIFAQANGLVISQIYGGGGNSGATYNADFIELFNSTASPIDLSGYSLQYASSGGSSWQKLDLTGTIGPGNYFLVQASTPGAVGAALPAVDALGNFGLASGAGKVAIIFSHVATNTGCPSLTALVDLVGYGSATLCFEGSGPAPGLSATLAAKREGDGCVDTDQNGLDFKAVIPMARNSQSPVKTCTIHPGIVIDSLLGGPFCSIVNVEGSRGKVYFTASGSVNSQLLLLLSDANGSFINALTVGDTAISGLNIAAHCSFTIPSNLPAGTEYRMKMVVVAQGSESHPSGPFAIYASLQQPRQFRAEAGLTAVRLKWAVPVPCSEQVMVVAKESAPITGIPSGDGSAYIADSLFQGSGSFFDGGRVVYKGKDSVVNVSQLNTGGHYYFKIFSRVGTSWSEGVEIEIPSLGRLDHLVISQLFAGGGNSGAPFMNDFVELFNPTADAIDLSAFSLQYAGASSSSWTRIDLTGQIGAGSYFLIGLAGGSIGAPLPPTDQAATVNLAASGGKVILSSSAGAYSLGCPGQNIVDLVGYGNTASCFETAAAAVPGNTLALVRSNRGCVDTDNNHSDLFTATASPRNSLYPSTSCIAIDPLPLSFLQVRLKEVASGVELSWAIGTDEIIHDMEVQRLDPSGTFRRLDYQIEELNAISGKRYKVIDKDVRSKSFYRIWVQTLKGVHYSPVLRFDPDQADPQLQHPLYIIHRSKDVVTIGCRDLPMGRYQFTLFDAYGRKIQQSYIVHEGGSLNMDFQIGRTVKGFLIFQLSGPAKRQLKFYAGN